MFKRFEFILIATILIIIAIVVGMQLIKGPLLIGVIAIAMPFLVAPLYRKCLHYRKKLQKYSFWNSYWYDMKCKLTVIPFILLGAAFAVWVNKL